MSSFLVRLLAGSLMFFTDLTFAQEQLLGDQYYRTAIRHIEGGGIGYNEGYTTLEGFVAANPDRSYLMPFLDARGHVFDKGKIATNVGIGLRRLVAGRVYGANLYYDYRNANRLHHCSQVGVGLESLGQRWDFRINGYVPVGKKITSPYNTALAGFSGHNLLLSQQYQFAMMGADAEIGLCLAKTRFFDFYAATGPYYYAGQIGPKVWGIKSRVSGKYKEYVTFEVSSSYDRMFRNNFQCQLTFTLPFGGGAYERSTGPYDSYGMMPDVLFSRMVRPVEREEIIVIGKTSQKTVAIDPATGLPLFFVFVNNTGHSDGSFESPYPTLALAQANSGVGDIIYVFPGDGTTLGMDAGIVLKADQKFWGSGVSHSIQTTLGTFTIPAESSTSPTITNTDIDTDGNAITLASNNAISGFTITSALNDAIYGTDPGTLAVSSCTFENTNTYAIEASFPGNASIALTNNQFLNNVNGVFLSLNGTSTLVCSNNTFTNQTSISSVPLEIAAASNILVAHIENNVFTDNTTGGIRLNLGNIISANLSVLNNTMTNNGTGAQASLGSSFVVLSTGINENCSILLRDNSFSGNTSNSLYLHTSGAFANLEITASANTMDGNGGSGLILATPVDNLTLLATDNRITGCNDNGIAVISSTVTSVGHITINDNVITDIGNASNGIAINQAFSTLDLTIANNEINRCEGTGVVSYAPTGIGSLTLNVADNVINNCQNFSSNAASGLDFEQYTNFEGSITDNTLLGNTGIAVVIGSTLPSPSACLTLSGNDSSTDYLLINPVDGLFNLSPCDVDAVNVGIINTSGVITSVQSCSDATPCPP